MTPRQSVLKQYPKAVCWWNCMEFDWIIWNGPAMNPTSRSLGSGVTKSEAWANAAKGIRTAMPTNRCPGHATTDEAVQRGRSK